VEGLAICIAIIIVVLVTAINDWQKEQAFARLNAKKEQREIKVTRSGRIIMISIYDVLAGDIIHLEPGDVIPVDGIFVDGSDVKCDESSATGESDAIRKTPGTAVMKALESGGPIKNLDPFIISGAKVLEGVGTFMATSVGVNSSFGRIMMSVRADVDPTPLQEARWSCYGYRQDWYYSCRCSVLRAFVPICRQPIWRRPNSYRERVCIHGHPYRSRHHYRRRCARGTALGRDTSIGLCDDKDAEGEQSCEGAASV